MDSFFGVWSIDASADALVVGGEFMNVNGVATQGVTILPPQAADPVPPGPPGTPLVTDTQATTVCTHVEPRHRQRLGRGVPHPA